MNLKSKAIRLGTSISTIILCMTLVFQLPVIAVEEEESLTSRILKNTRYQEMLTSSSENESAYSKMCTGLSTQDIGYIAGWYRDTLSMVNDILQNGETVGSAYNLPSRKYELNSAKVFVEYPNQKSETITLTWFLCSGPSGYSEQFAEINLGYTTIRPNSIVLYREFNNGEKHVIKLLAQSLDVYIYSSSGYRFNSSQEFTVNESDGTLTSPVKYTTNPNITVQTPGNKNNVKDNLYTYDYSTYEYRLLDDKNNVIEYPTDKQIVVGDIRINYKHYSNANWNLNNYNNRKISTYYLSCFYNNRNKSEIENQQFYYITRQYPGMEIYNISAPNYTNENFFDNKNVTYNSETNQYELDLDSLIDGLKLALPDVDTYLRPTFDFQPSVDGEFKVPLDLNLNDLFDDIVFPSLPDIPGGGGGGGGDITVNVDFPEYPEHTTTYIISAKPITSTSVDYINQEIDENIIKNSQKIVKHGYDFWRLSGLLPVIISIAVFGLFWKFTGE